MSREGLVYVGKIIEVNDIPGADFIHSVTVVCGEGGKWRGVCKKADLDLYDHCMVYLPDALIPESDEMSFMKSSGWRVKMRRFRGAPSECLIMPYDGPHDVGFDITSWTGVTKYNKPMPAHLQGRAIGYFPSFIPKTDELNYQRYPELVQNLLGRPFYVSEKADGSSTTAYRFKGNFGLCSRNLELEKDLNNGFWKVCEKYKVEERLPEGYAIQWETCGPGVQSNPMRLKELDGFMFSAFDIVKQQYLQFEELVELAKEIEFPMCRILAVGDSFDKADMELLSDGNYENAGPREGIVIRSQLNQGHAPISFKVINLGYEK